MIIVRLFGGLGNQMFQYAISRNLSLKHNVPLRFDLRLLNKDSEGKYQQRNLELDLFGVNVCQATDTEIGKYIAKNRKLIPRIIVKGYQYFFNYHIEVEKKFSFEDAVFHLGPNIYLDGFWQSEKYFLKYESEIRKDFSFPSFTDRVNFNLLSEIINSNSVSIHIRRGDYIQMNSAIESHPVCSIQYYQFAISKIKATVESPQLYFFSDDIEWVKNQFFSEENAIFVNHNKGKDSYKDMQLMANCKHNIIANSSFSWWGAWLNPNPKKMVIAPKNWFKDTSIDTSDLIPSTWIRL